MSGPRNSRSWLRVASATIDAERNEFIRGPKWRTKTTAGRRARAALLTFTGIVATGALLLGASMALLDWIGAPSWLVASLWAMPTTLVMIWTLARPRPAVPTDDDDDGWTTYSIQFVLVGDGAPRAAPIRVIAAALFGAPVVWSLVVFGLSTLIGLY